jgi:beta-lactamase superfamily II metal-dependent hydrolase
MLLGNPSMKIEIFDVEHGQCSIIHCPNGRKIMIDAGHNSTTGWRPSTHLSYRTDLLIISNFDEDHTSDLVDMRYRANVIWGNPSVNASALKCIKRDGMGPGIEAMYKLMLYHEAGLIERPSSSVSFGDVNVAQFWPRYPVFDDANNLSIATFISYGYFTILFPGDLEADKGWPLLLQSEDFRAMLGRVTVMVASHHGRRNGCCENVFDFCQPQLVVISDKGKEHATQETRDWYARRVSGCQTTDGAERRVITTRSDGKVRIQVQKDGGWSVSIASPYGELAELVARLIPDYRF